MALRSKLSRLRSWRRFTPDEGGASAVEFALVAPVLVVACLATVDLGLAISQKMDVDQSLRAASQGAMLDLGEDEVEDLAKAIAAENSTIAPDSGAAATDLDISVDRFCACPESVSAAVDCDSGTCADEANPYVFYRLTAEKDFASLFLPAIPISSSLLVHIE